MARWLVRFGYDGLPFAGWARQPGRVTVEGTLRRGLVRCGVAPSAEVARLAVASRTDRGVSARGNALVVDSRLDGPRVLRALNGIAPEIFFTHAAAVDEGFRVRGAVDRWYRYFEPCAGHDVARWQALAGRLSGRVDVRSLGRGIPPGEPVWRDLRSVTVSVCGDLLVVDVRAPSFVWGMVRKLVAAMRAVDAGVLEASALEASLAGRGRLTLALAEPEPLVLWDVRYGLDWQHRWTGPTRYQRLHFSERLDAARSRISVLESLAGAEGASLPCTPLPRE